MVYKMDAVSDILRKEAEKYKSISVDKHIELDCDLGGLLAVDSNELDLKSFREKKNDYLLNLTRDNVQILLNQIWELPTEQREEAIVVKLPRSKYLLPRYKAQPKPRPLTKWQEFAKLKGIQKKKKGKLSWDEQLKKWVPLYGFKRAVADREKNWVLEVPANADPMEDQFAKKNAGKAERVSKNELQRLRNIAKAKNVKVPRVGVTNSEVSTAKDLQAAVTVARSSTASLGKFQDKLPKEKEARGEVKELVPGASRKRKLPPVSSDQEKQKNLDIVDAVLNKRPKINIEKAVARHINQEQIERSEEKRSTKPKAGKRNSKNKNNKKLKVGKGQRKGKGKGGSVGRKRR